MKKADFRKSVRKVVLSLEEQTRAMKDTALSKILLQFYQDKFSGMKVGAFFPMKDEPNWFMDWKGTEAKLSFPNVKDKEQMVFVECQIDQVEMKKVGGLFCPSPNIQDATSILPDLLFVPGIAFTTQGNRLGRGGGFYDRYLETFQGTSIGICYEEQLQEKIPHEHHDKKVNYIVTDKNIYSCRNLS